MRWVYEAWRDSGIGAKLLRQWRSFRASLAGAKRESGTSDAAGETAPGGREPETLDALEARGEQWYSAMVPASGLERGKRYVEAFLCLIEARFLAERTEREQEAERLQARIDRMREQFLAGFASPELGEMAELEARGEKAYGDMYEAHGWTAAGGCYEDVTDYFARAIGLAERAGFTEEARRLEARLDHIRKVYRHQFS
jgi:hypothetical protein